MVTNNIKNVVLIGASALALAGCGDKLEDSNKFEVQAPLRFEVQTSISSQFPAGSNCDNEPIESRIKCSCSQLNSINANKFFIGHEQVRLSNGTLVTKFGSMKYLTNKDGTISSPGFHEIIPTSSGYNAILAACNYTLDHNGKITNYSAGENNWKPEFNRKW